MRVDQNQFFINPHTSSKAAGPSSGESFSAALSLTDQQTPLVDDKEDDAPIHGTLTESDVYKSGTGTRDTTSSLLDELSKWAHMNPAEMIRAQWLGSHGMTEESFSQLPSDEQAAINKQIAEEVKRQLTTEAGKAKTELG